MKNQHVKIGDSIRLTRCGRVAIVKAIASNCPDCFTADFIDVGPQDSPWVSGVMREGIDFVIL